MRAGNSAIARDADLEHLDRLLERFLVHPVRTRVGRRQEAFSKFADISNEYPSNLPSVSPPLSRAGRGA